MQFLIVGVARNCGKTIVADFQRIEAAFRPHGETRWLVIESDSSDNTNEHLQSLASPSFRSVSLGNLRESIPARTARIAHCRNRYLAELRNDPAYSNVDYVVVADLDGINSQITPGAVHSCFNRDDWEVCTANQRGPYYDIFALRHPVWSSGDCLAQFRFLHNGGISERRALFAAVYSKMITVPPNARWIDVGSAYGGLAIYRKSVLMAGQYCGLNAANEQTCEHVALHTALRASGHRIKINPALINAGYTEHTRHFLPLPGLKHSAKLALKSAIRALAGSAGLEQFKARLRQALPHRG
jgi:hypothetical protein